MLFNFIPLFYQKFEMNRGVIKLIKNPKKTKQIKLSFKNEDVKKFNNSLNIVLHSQVIKKIDILTLFGIKNSPRIVALIYGVYNLIVGNFFCIYTAKMNILKSHSNIKTSFKHTNIKIKIFSTIKISIYQFVSIIFQIKTGVKT